MELKHQPSVELSGDLLDAIRNFPVQREAEHCGSRIVVSPFDIYAQCPHCGSRIKMRSFSAVTEIEDVFDAVFEWLNRPEAQEVARRRHERLQTIANNSPMTRSSSGSLLHEPVAMKQKSPVPFGTGLIISSRPFTAIP
jgi:hypothetical protein